MDLNEANPLTVFLCGDVMTSRGIDQILPHPSSPMLCESYIIDARDYVELAEGVNGPIRRPMSFEYIWGDFHWGGNWGYEIFRERVAFAHLLVPIC